MNNTKMLQEPPYHRQRGFMALTDSWRCTVVEEKTGLCKRVELSHGKMVLHLSVEHGIRVVKVPG